MFCQVPAITCYVPFAAIATSSYAPFGVLGHKITNDTKAEQFQQAHTHPVQVMFYEKENWTFRKGNNGVTFGSRGP